MSKKHKTTKSQKPAPIPSIGDNTEIEHDAIVGEALSVVRLWESAEKTAQNADSMAVHVIVRAHEFGFFGDSANVANWHLVATKEVRTALLDTILTDLFSMEKPKASDRQRLQRIRLIVPALIKSGGSNTFSLSKTNVLMVATECEYFKNCGIKAEVEGRMGLSIIQLDRGARKYLKGELPVDKRAAKKVKDRFKGIPSSALAKEIEHRLAKTAADKWTTPERNSYKHLLVQLLGAFATSDDGKVLDTGAVEEIYQAAAN